MPEEFDRVETVEGLKTGDNRQITEVSLVEAARNMVYALVCQNFDKSDPPVDFTPDNVFVVWFCKTLQNWKALVSTTIPDQMYYEVTFDGDKKQVYIDSYKKFRNEAFNFVES